MDYRIQSENGAIQFSETGIRELRRAVNWTMGSMAAATLAQQVEEALLLREGLLSSGDSVVSADITTQGVFRNYSALVGISNGRQKCASILTRMYELECAVPADGWRINLRRRGKANEPNWSDLSFELVIDEQRAAIYHERAQVRDHFNVRQALRSVVSGAVQHWSTNGMDEIVLGLQDVLGPYRIDRDIAAVQSSANSLQEVMAGAERILEQAIADRGEDVGSAQMDGLMRRIQLAVIDQQWSQHLARVRFIQRHGNLLDGTGTDVSRQQVQEIRELYFACRQRIREYTIAYALNMEL
jgi:preprotein translocase subunit SecA